MADRKGAQPDIPEPGVGRRDRSSEAAGVLPGKGPATWPKGPAGAALISDLSMSTPLDQFPSESTAKEVPKTINQEIARWLQRLHDVWFPIMTEPLSGRARFSCAFAGSSTWIFFVFLSPNRSQAQAVADLFRLAPERADWLVLFSVAYAVLFAGLVSWRPRPCGPTRYFIDGLLLPSVTALIIGVAEIPAFREAGTSAAREGITSALRGANGPASGEGQ